MERQHDARQPFIEDELIQGIISYNCVSYRQLALHINNWCQHTCIAKWLHSHETYSLYAKNIKPGLTPDREPAKASSFQSTCSRPLGSGGRNKDPVDPLWWEVVPRDRSENQRQSVPRTWRTKIVAQCPPQETYRQGDGPLLRRVYVSRGRGGWWWWLSHLLR